MGEVWVAADSSYGIMRMGHQPLTGFKKGTFVVFRLSVAQVGFKKGTFVAQSILWLRKRPFRSHFFASPFYKCVE